MIDRATTVGVIATALTLASLNCDASSPAKDEWGRELIDVMIISGIYSGSGQMKLDDPTVMSRNTVTKSDVKGNLCFRSVNRHGEVLSSYCSVQEPQVTAFVDSTHGPSTITLAARPVVFKMKFTPDVAKVQVSENGITFATFDPRAGGLRAAIAGVAPKALKDEAPVQKATLLKRIEGVEAFLKACEPAKALAETEALLSEIERWMKPDFSPEDSSQFKQVEIRDSIRLILKNLKAAAADSNQKCGRDPSIPGHLRK